MLGVERSGRLELDAEFDPFLRCGNMAILDEEGNTAMGKEHAVKGG